MKLMDILDLSSAVLSSVYKTVLFQSINKRGQIVPCGIIWLIIFTNCHRRICCSGGRDYIIIQVLVIISGLTMSSVAQHCLLLVASLNENDKRCLMLEKCATWKSMKIVLRQQFWTSPNWISFFHIRAFRRARSYLWHCQWCSQGNLFRFVSFWFSWEDNKKESEKDKFFSFLRFSGLRDDGTRMIDENNKR